MKKNKIDRFKSRFVVDGSMQERGVDFKETFAPVVKNTTFRLFVAMSAVLGLRIDHLDVRNAFINAPLHEDVYMRPHPEMKIPDGYCLKLLKSLYGLKQAPRNWNQHLHQFIISLGFIQCPQDTCLYKVVINDNVVLLAVFVDDILIACKCLTLLTSVKDKFKSKFEMTDSGMVTEFLGVRIIQKPHCISLDQSFYIDQLLKKYSKYIGRRNYSNIPMKHGHIPRNHPAQSDKQQRFIDSFPYSEIVGALLYLSVVTRLDIAFAVGVFTRHMQNPTFEACCAVCRCLNYLAENKFKGLLYSGTVFNMHAYCDSDWASDLDTRRSTSGYVVLVAGGPTAWMSKLQPIVATSSMESEYICCFFVTQDVTWHRGVFDSLDLTRTLPTVVRIDNKSAQSLANNPVFHQRSKHIMSNFIGCVRK